MRLFVTIFMLVLTVLNTNAQATDLVIDNQTPGWLSNKINFGDQQTVRNLKVTGYINAADLKFIGTLIQLRNLDGELDLSECDVVSETTDGNDNYLVGMDLSAMSSIKVYRIPQSIESAYGCTHNLHVDSLFFDCKITSVDCTIFDGINTSIDYLNLGESVVTISGQPLINSGPNKGFYGVQNIKQVVFPLTMKNIDDLAFFNSGIEKINLEELNNLDYIGSFAFVNYSSMSGLSSKYQPDTLWFDAKSVNASAFAYKTSQHVFITNRVETIGSGADLKKTYAFTDNLIFHMESITPPSGVAPNSTCTVYVPKGSKAAYLSSSWQYANIIEESRVSSLSLTMHTLSLGVGTQQQLYCTISPSDADNKSLIWTSSDTNIAEVNGEGVITTKKSGVANITVQSVSNPDAKDVCVLTVSQPVTGITLSESVINFKSIGRTKQLVATISPENATNKNVNWTSPNAAVCTVSETGLVTATGAGTSIVIATTVDGNKMAYCTVNVTPTDHATFTMNANGIATFSDEDDLDFTSVSGLKAYIGSGYNPTTGDLTMTRVYEVPAGEGLLLKGATGSYEIPYNETKAIYANFLVGVPTATTIGTTDGDYTNFILANGANGIGFYKANAGEIGANKAYLKLPTSALPVASARQLRMVFDDEEEEVTGINDATRLNDKGEMRNDKLFDLQGRRVVKPTRGLYVKDGKKVFVK